MSEAQTDLSNEDLVTLIVKADLDLVYRTQAGIDFPLEVEVHSLPYGEDVDYGEALGLIPFILAKASYLSMPPLSVQKDKITDIYREASSANAWWDDRPFELTEDGTYQSLDEDGNPEDEPLVPIIELRGKHFTYYQYPYALVAVRCNETGEKALTRLD